MDLVTGAMGNLAPKLFKLLQAEYNLQKGVKDKIKFVSDEMESIHAVLRKVAAVPPDQLDEQVKIWAVQVRESSYDMDDILDTFLARLEGCPKCTDQAGLKGALKRMGKLFTEAKARRDIASAIEDIKKKLQEVAERRDRYKIEEKTVAKPAAAASTIDPRLEALYKDKTQLVGIDGAMAELISVLSLQWDEVSKSNDKLKIVSLLGIGGLGKTTLAKLVYDKKKSLFDCGAFVPVGRNPNLKKVFQDILIDLDRHKYTAEVNVSRLDERQLIDELREYLGNKRYFIVIDDVWEKESWETIRLAFIDNNRGSRIISTTRKSEVTIGNKIYKPKPLSDEDSKRLFYKRIFGGDDKCSDKQVDEVSDEILKKCSGIPLAIIAMASLLVDKSKGEWSEVCKSMGFCDKDIDQLDRTMWILSLSYYDLPYHLRTCLLYLSAFPEDYFIDKNSLIWKWIAEDFVHSKKPGTGLFEVGEGYFNELVNRSMIQAVESQNDGIIDGCRVHDMVLDLLCSLSHEENFVIISGNNEDIVSTRSIRRLSHRKSKIMASMGKRKSMLKMKSFIGYWCGVDVELPFLSFKLLRVLDLEHVYSKRWHNSVCLGNLIHLRYLGFKRTDMHELPKEIGALKFLQTLDLVGNVFIQQLPSTLCRLTQLVCLRAWGTISWGTSMPNGLIRKLKSLEELVVQCNSGDEHNKYKVQFLKELGNLTALRVLIVKVIEMDQSKLSDLVQSVASLHNIQCLKVEPHCPDRACVYNATFHAGALPRHLRQLVVSGQCFSFSSFPSCIDPSCHIKLSHLELDVISMDEQSMVVLGGLPELRHLVLSTKSTVTITNIATDGCFQKLRFGKFSSSMVLIVLNEDSIISFTLWNGTSDLVFGPTKKDERCSRAPAVMPNLEELSFKLIDLWPSRKGEGSSWYDSLGWEYVASLQKVTLSSDDAQMMEAEDKLRHATAVHPNHPTLIFQTPTKFVSLASGPAGDTEEQEGDVAAPVSGDDVTRSRRGTAGDACT